MFDKDLSVCYRYAIICRVNYSSIMFLQIGHDRIVITDYCTMLFIFIRLMQLYTLELEYTSIKNAQVPLYHACSLSAKPTGDRNRRRKRVVPRLTSLDARVPYI